MSLPNLPVMRPEMLCKGNFSDNQGRHCLLGWACKVGLEKRTDDKQWTRWNWEITQGGGTVTSFNDFSSLDVVAKAWNDAAVALGYVQEGDQFVYRGL